MFVYIIGQPDPTCDEFKVGITSAPLKQRLSTLQTGNPRRLDLVAAVEVHSFNDAASVEREMLTLDLHFRKRFCREPRIGEWIIGPHSTEWWIETLRDQAAAIGVEVISEHRPVGQRA